MPRSYSRTPGSWLFYGTDLVSCTMVVWSAHLCCFGRGYKRHGWGCGCRNYKYYQLPYKVKVWDTYENTKCCYCYQQCLISLVNIDKFTILKTFLTIVVNLFFCFFWMVEIPHQCCVRWSLRNWMAVPSSGSFTSMGRWSLREARRTRRKTTTRDRNTLVPWKTSFWWGGIG